MLGKTRLCKTLKCLKQLCLNCNTYWPFWQSLHLLMLVCETIMHVSIGQTRILTKTNNLLLQIIIIKTCFGEISVQKLIFGSWQQAVTVVNSVFRRILFSSCVNMQRLFQLPNNVMQNISNQVKKGKYKEWRFSLRPSGLTSVSDLINALLDKWAIITTDSLPSLVGSWFCCRGGATLH